MAVKNTEVDKEMAKLLEQFALQYHETMIREVCRTMVVCGCAMAIVSFGLERVRQSVRERNFRKMYQTKK